MSKKAWYVDDDQEMIQAISMMMSLLEIEIRPFMNAQAVSRAFADGEVPELLFLDINMPQVSGIDLLEFVRRNPRFDHLPIIMLSSEDTDLQVQEALDKGADAYVMKPVSLEEIETAVRDALRKRSA